MILFTYVFNVYNIFEIRKLQNKTSHVAYTVY